MIRRRQARAAIPASTVKNMFLVFNAVQREGMAAQKYGFTEGLRSKFPCGSKEAVSRLPAQLPGHKIARPARQGHSLRRDKRTGKRRGRKVTAVMRKMASQKSLKFFTILLILFWCSSSFTSQASPAVAASTVARITYQLPPHPQ